MPIDTSKYGPPPAPPRVPNPLAGLTGPINFPTPAPGSPPFQNTPIGGPHYTGPPLSGGPSWGTPIPTPAPAAPHPAPAPTAAPPQASPLDSTYYMNVATHDFDVNNRIAGLNQQTGYNNDDLQRALVQLAHSQALNERTDRERANSSGLLSSTTLANTLGELTRSGGDRQSLLQTQTARRNAAILSEIAALRGGQPLYDMGQALASAGRRSAADAANPALGELPPVGPGGAGSGSGGTGAGSGLPGTPAAPIQIYRPRTDPTGHLLPPVPGQPPLVRPANLPPPPRRRPDDKGPVSGRAY